MTALDKATSPYLLPHKDKPVATGAPGALRRWRRRKRGTSPSFPAIGYAGCHWCHLLNQDSFRKQIAALINDNFVPVLVDREERPDLDQFHQAAAAVLMVIPAAGRSMFS